MFVVCSELTYGFNMSWFGVFEVCSKLTDDNEISLLKKKQSVIAQENHLHGIVIEVRTYAVYCSGDRLPLVNTITSCL